MLSKEEKKFEELAKAGKLKEGVDYCAKCYVPFRWTRLPSYEYLVGHPLYDVPAYKCPKCGQIFFTERQAHNMERRTKQELKKRFAFERSIIVSGRSLVFSIPPELARHLQIKQGQKVKVVPVDKIGFIVTKKK